jgi:hypothetical protein
MAIIYTGSFRAITGLRHPTTVLPSNANLLEQGVNFIGVASGMAVTANLIAVNYQSYGTNDPSGNARFSGECDIYQCDTAGEIVSKLTTITPVGGSFSYVPGGVSFSPTGSNLAISFTKSGSPSSSGIYIYSYDGTATFTFLKVLVGVNMLNFQWHEDGETYYAQTNSTQYIGNCYSGTTTSIPVSSTAGIGGPVTSAIWCGDTLSVAYEDVSNSYAPRWALFNKNSAARNLTLTFAANNISLVPDDVIGLVKKIDESTFVFVNEVTGAPLLMAFSVSSTSITPLAGPSDNATNQAYTYIDYCPSKKRLIFGNQTSGFTYSNTSGRFVLEAGSQPLFAVRTVKAISSHPTSGDLLVLGDYEVLTYVLPSSGVFVPPIATQAANSTLFAWNFDAAVNTTTAAYAPTIQTSQFTQTVSFAGSPIMATAPSPLPSNHGADTTSMSFGIGDSISYTKGRDFEFMYYGFSLEFYFYFSQLADHGRILSDTGGAFTMGHSGTAWQPSFNSDTQTFSFGFGETGGALSGSTPQAASVILPMSPQTWHHVALTYTVTSKSGFANQPLLPLQGQTPLQGTLFGYVDGQQTTQSFANYGSFSSVGANYYPWFPSELIGNSLTFGGGFAGHMHKFNIYNYPKFSGFSFTPSPF